VSLVDPTGEILPVLGAAALWLGRGALSGAAVELGKQSFYNYMNGIPLSCVNFRKLARASIISSIAPYKGRLGKIGKKLFKKQTTGLKQDVLEAAANYSVKQLFGDVEFRTWFDEINDPLALSFIPNNNPLVDECNCEKPPVASAPSGLRGMYN